MPKVISEGSTQWLIVCDREDKLYLTWELEEWVIYVYFNQSKESWIVERGDEVIFSQNCQLLEDGKAKIRRYGLLVMYWRLLPAATRKRLRMKICAHYNRGVTVR